MSEEQELEDYLNKLGKVLAKAVFKGTHARYENELENNYASSYSSDSPEVNSINRVEFAVNNLHQKLTEINNSIQALSSAIYSLKDSRWEK